MTHCPHCGEKTWTDGEGCSQCTGANDAYIASMRALYEGEKAAGLLDSREEYEAKMRDAGRGHLLR